MYKSSTIIAYSAHRNDSREKAGKKGKEKERQTNLHDHYESYVKTKRALIYSDGGSTRFAVVYSDSRQRPISFVVPSAFVLAVMGEEERREREEEEEREEGRTLKT